jgi:glucan phosphoethanolaminetransferase (alkaline phosphatase superfamily)
VAILYIHVLAQVQAADAALQKEGLDSAVSFAQSLSQWAYVTIGASVAFLLKGLAQRPKNRFVRWWFVTFIAGWWFLIFAIWKGVRVHGDYISYLMNSKRDYILAVTNINADASAQLRALKYGLWIFSAWLVIYLGWWIMHPDGPKQNENLNNL